ncbi:hypothetical protein KM043_008498 [Ampulex compressa]|nr:hypothetical protein KM043_008498 [Ampulex compressa]
MTPRMQSSSERRHIFVGRTDGWIRLETHRGLGPRTILALHRRGMSPPRRGRPNSRALLAGDLRADQSTTVETFVTGRKFVVIADRGAPRIVTSGWLCPSSWWAPANKSPR